MRGEREREERGDRRLVHAHMIKNIKKIYIKNIYIKKFSFCLLYRQDISRQHV